MKIERFNESSYTSKFKYFPEKTDEENAEILQGKFQKKYKDEDGYKYNLRCVYMDRFGKLSYVDSYLYNLSVVGTDIIKLHIKSTMKVSSQFKYAYLIKQTTTIKTEVGPNLKELIDECKTEVESEKYNL